MNKYARHKARSLVAQALYQWQITQDSYTVLAGQFAEHLNPRKVDAAYFQQVLMGCLAHYQELMKLIITLAEREAEQLTLVEKAVMLLATYELQFKLDVPYEVVINEALELDKKFGAVEGYRVVNAVLDRAAKQLRASEYDLRHSTNHLNDEIDNKKSNKNV